MGFASARKNAGLTQKEVAEQLDIDQSAISLWETGRTRPRAALLLKLAGLYICTVDELLKPDEKEEEQTVGR